MSTACCRLAVLALGAALLLTAVLPAGTAGAAAAQPATPTVPLRYTGPSPVPVTIPPAPLRTPGAALPPAGVPHAPSDPPLPWAPLALLGGLALLSGGLALRRARAETSG